ncbi:hypothetical protein Hanom_Chr01g00011661 [Helianthus anomalus]
MSIYNSLQVLCHYVQLLLYQNSLVSTPPTVEDVRLWGMGRGLGLGRGLGTNGHVTTPGRLGFRRGPLGWGFSPGVGRGYEHYIEEPRWPRALAL